MQESSPPSSWPYAVYLLVAGFLGYVVKHGVDYIKLFLERRKPHAEIHRTQAESTEIFIRAGATAGDFIARMMDRLDQAQLTIDRLRQERDAWQDEYDKEFTQRKALTLRVDLLIIEADSLKDQMEGAYSYIKFLGRHPTDVDKFRVQLKSEKESSPES